MLFPLQDEYRPFLRLPVVTLILIGLNIIIFVYSLYYGLGDFIDKYGMVPQLIMDGQQTYTLFTSLFLHASILHLLGNMWFFWIFGDNVEDFLGPWLFISLFFLCGLVADWTYIITASQEALNIVTVGASGAISGLLGAYLVLFPRNKIKSIIWLVITAKIINVPAYFYIIFWFVLQLLYNNYGGEVAYMAHIGGFICGVVATYMIKPYINRRDFLKIHAS